MHTVTRTQVPRPLRVIQYGCGKMGHICLRYLYEKGAEIVGAIDTDPALVGKDIGEVGGLGCELNLLVRDDPEAVFAECDADTAIVAVASTVEDSYPHFEVALRHGVNVISLCEEAFFPWRTSPVLTNRLDSLAKQHGCTICGSGGNDIFMGNLGIMLAGGVHKLDKIESVITVNLDDYGIALAEHCGPNLTPEDFARKFADRDDMVAYASGSWIASRMGWTVRSQSQLVNPTFHDKDLPSSTLDTTIPAGYSTGSDLTVTTETFQGPVIVQHIIDKVFPPGEIGGIEWFVYGEPSVHCIIEKPAIVEHTCATVVNRVPSLVEAPPGYVTTEKHPIAEYRTYPFHTYHA